MNLLSLLTLVVAGEELYGSLPSPALRSSASSGGCSLPIKSQLSWLLLLSLLLLPVLVVICCVVPVASLPRELMSNFSGAHMMQLALCSKILI